jgi:multisubunit Na+/H+ antiporter MnhB subunit
MKELIVYSVAAVSSLFILGYTVHMFVGGLVEPKTEIALVATACVAGALVMGLMAWDVLRRRRR